MPTTSTSAKRNLLAETAELVTTLEALTNANAFKDGPDRIAGLDTFLVNPPRARMRANAWC